MKIRVLAGTNVIVGHRLEAFMQAMTTHASIVVTPPAHANSALRRIVMADNGLARTNGGPTWTPTQSVAAKGINDEH